MAPLRERIWFAGEAVHETLWGTVGGAWESGERAAASVLAQLAVPPRPDRRAPRAQAPEQRPRRRASPPSRFGPDSVPYPFQN
jgi:hypothetical protein